MQGLKAKTIEEVLALPDEEIDIATAALILSKQWDSTVDIEKYRRQIDEMATLLKPIVAKAQPPDTIVKSINDYIFREFRDVPASAIAPIILLQASQGREGKVDEKLFLLHCVLDRKRADCVGLSMLYLSLSERLNLPIYGVIVPNHFFVRYDDNMTRINIETTGKRKSRSDTDYTQKSKVPIGTDNSYLVNLSKKETVGCFLINLGAAYNSQGKIGEAIRLLEFATSITPNLAEAHVNLGVAYAMQGKSEAAIVEFRAAILINPNLVQAHVTLGAIFIDQGKVEEAATALKTAISINPNLAEAYVNLGVIYTYRGKLEEAIAALKTAIRINPKQSAAHVNLGNIYLEQGNVEKAIASYKTGISINPNLAEAHNNLGIAYSNQGKLEEAITSCKNAISINPNLALAHYSLACCYSLRNSKDQAIESLEKTIALDASYTDMAKVDEDFDSIKGSAEFQNLVGK